jgi:UDP-3-O-[3-hydroxymyristoyl] glucosamine N-acyltransferase LpxD
MRFEGMGSKARYYFSKSREKQRRFAKPEIGANCSIDKTVIIGSYTEIGDNVVIRGKVTIGDSCHIKSHACIGEKGFSFGFDEDGKPIAIRHDGEVRIGNNVEIGSFSTVCMSTLEGTATVLEDNVKLDDNVHIAHNCHIGENTCLAAGCMLNGSVVIGKNCWIGLNVTLNKVKIGDNVLVGSGSMVTKDIPSGMVAAGVPAKIIRERREVND